MFHEVHHWMDGGMFGSESVLPRAEQIIGLKKFIKSIVNNFF